MKRLGLSHIDPDQNRAQQDRDTVASVQDLQGIEIGITSPGMANQEFVLVLPAGNDHVPRAVQVLLCEKGGAVYASRKVEWNKRRIFLKCTVAADNLLLLVR